VRVYLPYSLASADFDDDGDSDLVATSYGLTGGCCVYGEVKVVLGNGDGTFGTGQSFRVGSGHTGPSAVASADLDTDGREDLVVSNSASDDVSVMLGNGDGTFGAAQNFPAGDLPAFVISPDLDADGIADLAVANQDSDNVSVLLNTESQPPPPETTVTKGPPNPDNSTSATFEFSSSEPGSTFQCALDVDAPSAYSPCTSPKTVPDVGQSLAEDWHTFYVKATGTGGTDPTPAKRTWKVDTTAPIISNVSPADRSQNVLLATNVEAIFSEDMDASDTDGDPSTLTTSTFTLTKQGSSNPVGARVSYDNATKKATLDPTSDLEANTTYTATIKGGSTGVEDLAGNGLAQDYTWTFTTAVPAAPTAMAPKHSFTTLSTLGTSTVPVKLTWSATDNTGGSGIASYQLQQSVNGGAYTNIALPSATATTISPSLAPGTNTYRYRVAAKDNAGNLSAWATGPSFKVSAFQESSSAIVDTGSWTTAALSGAYGGSVQYAGALGKNATFTVPAGSKNVEWVSYRGNRGKAQVWLDGVQQDANPNVTGIQPFDLYSSTVQARKVIFSKAVSSTTSHKVEVRVLGKKNASSTSTRVDIDAFVTTS
jgi:hypothetical protein